MDNMSKSEFDKWHNKVYCMAPEALYVRDKEIWLAALKWALSQKTYPFEMQDKTQPWLIDPDKIKAELKKAGVK
jgi:hypothetical protein